MVDEVLAVGDAEFQKKCLGKMSDVAHEGRTVLFVSHNMGAIRSLCGNAILLKSGYIACLGPTEEIVQTYLSGLSHGAVNTTILPEAHLHYPPRFEVTKVELINARGQVADTLLVNETYECRIYYKIN